MRSVCMTVILFFCLLSLQAWGGEFDLTYYTEESPPQNFTENGELKGLAVELLQRIWNSMGVKFAPIQVVPWARGYLEVQTRPNTVLFAMTRLPERERLFKWVGPIRTTRFALIAKKGSPVRISSVEDIKRYRIGTIINDGTELRLIQMGLQKQLDSSSTLQSAIAKLDLGRVDLIAYGDQNLRYFMETNGIDPAGYNAVYTLAKSSDYYAFHKDTPDKVIHEFQQALQAVKKEKTFSDLSKKYQSSGL